MGAHERRVSLVVLSRKLGAVLLLFLCVSGSFAALSNGGLFDDDVSHYLAARYSWTHPELLVDVWARPAYTVLASPLAQLGWPATRWLNVALSLLACFLAFRLAGYLGIEEPWLAAAFTAIQPLFFQLSYGTLTEPVFAVLLAAATLLYYEKRFAASALCISALPLARGEGGAFLVGWFFLLLRQRRLNPILCLGVFPSLWIFAAWGLTGDLLYVVHRNPYLTAHPYPEAELAALSTKLSHWADYLVRWPVITGPALLPLVSLSLMVGVTGRGRLIHAICISYLVLQSFIMMTGRIGFFSSGNESFFPRFFVSVAPLLGVISAQAVQHVLSRPRGLLVILSSIQAVAITWWYYQPFSRVGRLGLVSAWLVAMAAISVCVLPKRAAAALYKAGTVLVFAIGIAHIARWVEPYRTYPSGEVCNLVGQWLRGSEYRARPLIALNPSFWLAANRDPFDRTRLDAFVRAGGYDGLPESLQAIPGGTIVVWDSVYFPRHAKIPLESLDAASFRVLHSSATTDDPSDALYRDDERVFELVILEKIEPSNEPTR